MAPEFYDIRILRGSRTRIVLDNGKLEEIAQAPFQGAAVRALHGGAWGFVTTDNVSDLGEEIDLAKRIARKIDRREDLALAEAPPGRSVVVPVKKDPKNLSLEEKVALLREIEDAAKSRASPPPRPSTPRWILPRITAARRAWIWRQRRRAWALSSAPWPTETGSTRRTERADRAWGAWSSLTGKTPLPWPEE